MREPPIIFPVPFVLPLIAAGVFAAVHGAHAYTPTRASNGAFVKWGAGRTIHLAGNPSNHSGVSAEDFRSAVIRGLKRWKNASGGAVGFNYWQGTDPSVYETNSDYNGLSSVYFSSASGERVDPGVIGLTQVWYDVATGEILETDIVLNDTTYDFTADPRDSTGYGQGHPNYDQRVYIENVVTHELGHAYGLSHSASHQGTMLYLESPEQANLSCDELSGIRSVYPQGDLPAAGTLTGTIEKDAQPVFGAHVAAISASRGVVMATAMTDRNGRYRIGGLEPGSYHVMAEPYLAGSSSLSTYYENMDTRVCAGRNFSRTFLTQAGGNRLRDVTVGAGREVSAPVLSPVCAGERNAAVYGPYGSPDIPDAPTLVSGDGAAAVADRVAAGNTVYYRLEGVEGEVEVSILSQTLYSPVRVFADLVDPYGNPVGARTASPVFTGSSGYRNFDAAIRAEDLPSGDYYVRITTMSHSLYHYPGGPTAIDSTPFVVVSARVNRNAPAHAAVTPRNARCQMDEPDDSYAGPGGEPLRHAVDGDGGVGFCGTLAMGALKAAAGRRGGGPPPPSAGAVAGWFLPWAVMLLAVRPGRRRKLRPLAAAVNLE